MIHCILTVTNSARTILISLILAGFAVGGALDFSPAPPDNPLRGMAPYTSASGKERFPHSMEFRYFALKNLMKGPEEYDWLPIEESLAEVNDRGNQLIFRIYCEYPGKELAIPRFLVDAGVEVTKWTNPENGQVSHTPDYGDLTLREALTAFIGALGAKYDGDPRLAFITAGLLGSWGEWHTHPKDDLWASKQVQREIMDTYAKAFTKTKILLRYPAGTEAFAYAENHERPFGYHDDSFAWATLDSGQKEDSWFFEPSLIAAGATDKWKRFPIGGELRPELWTQSFTNDPHPQGQEFVKCVEQVHATWLMDDTSIPMDEARMTTALRQVARMGYELHVSRAEWKEGILTLTVENVGVAPFYYDWPVEIKLDGQIKKTSWKLSGILPKEPRTWSIGMVEKKELRVRILNPMKGGKPLRFANRDQEKEWLLIKP